MADNAVEVVITPSANASESPSAVDSPPATPEVAVAAERESPSNDQPQEGESTAEGLIPVPGEGEGVVGEVAVKPEPAKPAKKEDWRDARIRRLTAQLSELKGKVGGAADAAAVTEATPSAGTSASLSEADVERRANEIASQQRQVETFNQACTTAYNQGKEQFVDFDDKVKELMQLRGSQEDQSQQVAYNSFIAAAIKTGEGPKLLHSLGGDLNEASRIMAMHPVDMAVELTKIALKGPASAETSKAAKPITPVGGKGASHTLIDPGDSERADRLSTAEWMKRRNEQVNRKRA